MPPDLNDLPGWLRSAVDWLSGDGERTQWRTCLGHSILWDLAILAGAGLGWIAALLAPDLWIALGAFAGFWFAGGWFTCKEYGPKGDHWTKPEGEEGRAGRLDSKWWDLLLPSAQAAMLLALIADAVL